MTLTELIARFRPLTPTPAGDWETLKRQMEELSDLEDAWDGCIAPAPSLAAFERAVQLIFKLKALNAPLPVRVVPSVNGTVVMDWIFDWPEKKPNYTYCEVEVYDSLPPEVFISNGVDPSTLADLEDWQ